MSVLVRYLMLAVVGLSVHAHAEVLKTADQFVEESFSAPPKRGVLWVTKDLREQLKTSVGYQLSQLRVRYWGADKKTAWILEEVGKEQPITMGVVVEGDRIASLDILVYRESRGDEVKHAFYRRQFDGAALREKGDKYRLDRSIDGITGATLSVRATKKVATLALLLHKQTPYGAQEEKK